MLSKPWLVVYLLAFIGCVLASHTFYNPSKSARIGYYFYYPSLKHEVGDLVLICVIDDLDIKVLFQARLPRTSAACAHDVPFLLKHVAAKSGDIVERTADGIWVNDILQLNSKSFEQIRGIRFRVPKWKKIQLKDDEFFVLGDTVTSYDSRYFGVVKRDQIYATAIFLF